MDAPNQEFVRVGSLEELKAEGRLVVQGGHRPILVIYDRGRVFALDNRCPHMGFPLERGSVEDGILTCHWHHARFDLESGCTFDLWADDIPTCAVEVRNGDVWVTTTFGHPDPAAHWRQRLADGLAHDLDLVIAKAVQGQLAANVPMAGTVRQVALFGAQNRDGWGVGLTILTALANLLPFLPEDEAYLALFHGARRVAADCAGEAPRRERAPLGSRPEPAALKRWLRLWTSVRHREAGERTLLTAIAAGVSPAVLADALLSAATERVFADTGHSLDFINKALECLDLIGWDHAPALLPTIVGQMVAARGAEESTAWRQPVDLVALCEESARQMPELFAAARTLRGWSHHAALARELLGDDPAKIIDALKAAIRAGATPVDLGRSLAYGAVLRVARFGNANEHADWETAHHVFTYANAVHQMLRRIGTADIDGYVTAVRAVMHGAMALYLARYLNVPPARIPGEDSEQLDDLPADVETIRAALLDAFDRQRQVDLAARLVARHLTLGHSPQALIATLALAVLREDAGFHAYQMLEAGVRQFTAWGNTGEGRHVLIAVARYLAAHSPTERGALQTADIARRLMRGVAIHEGAGAS
ncbi:Rieske (2Fe-2S) protein [Paraburkholderia terricola]|uniref:Nitrite reductase/ring-hydroxylating ferredoxin subunit n=1 Tax=Paraburkholderia terricola TaxID=169427 RepID=A0ABU1M219_9BURK|nr:Rieske (2Fe-2S) protein [Paraburkholderia terricola]MDR6413043.1 nitrite reductase/ring-hydroxylating ferredoxin subunit [Paraburkholderia terricola]MDR6485359.1 nitrite reductase/ring-hydroxylating ferredoxin subunit [Paraburkholderia terricola]